ncbi:efflux RND transporter periplasmic adaptor subunit [Rhodohalobacter sp.]|uniref:efflux RND transporter periplasmic adaptor subunit n=1 Tax=Rhodohalobacter sp. TaxID=1974210 RepID=UPI002ACE9594|nr:biotin/lipoyl-binding protein [Rhodohalobacter sp.]MDZ7756271.1 biotin/lipoyl-binding protein [Rhodohalobacter sp.]
MIGFSACSGDSSESEQNDRNENAVIPSVEATQARCGPLPLVERFSGNVKAENQVTLYAEFSGVIDEVYVQNGDFVEKGEALVKLNTQVLEQQLQQARAGLKINQAQLKQAKANLSRTKADFNRIKQLEEKDLTSQAEVEQAEAELLSAEADVELSEAQVEQAESPG